MKRLKFLNAFLMLIMTLIVPFVLTSCEDEESTEKTELTKYKWYSENTDYLLYGKDGLNSSIQTDRIWLYFLANGTGIMSCRTTDKDTYFGTSRDEIAYRFNYTVSGGKVNLSFKDSNLNRTLTYNKDFLTDSENRVSYKALSFTSSELDHAKELADEQEFQESINHNQIQSLDVFIGFGNNLQPVKFTSDYLWSVSFSCLMPKDSYRRGITLAGLVIYIDNGTITNKTGYDKESACTVEVVKLDGKNAYYFEHAVYSNEETQCGASMNVYSSSGSALKIHRAYRYYDNVSKTYFTSPSQEFVLTGDGIDASGEDDTTDRLNEGKAVDLGLSVKWADRNIGANNPEEFGEYFAWGETKTKSSYTSSNYYYLNSTKYHTSTKSVLDLEDDVAHVKWKGAWRMPTPTELMELKNRCTWEWIQDTNDLRGYKVTGPNGKSIFLPAAGYMLPSGIFKGIGCYWSNSLDYDWQKSACHLRFYYENVYLNSEYSRSCGMSVRPVCP